MRAAKMLHRNSRRQRTPRHRVNPLTCARKTRQATIRIRASAARRRDFRLARLKTFFLQSAVRQSIKASAAERKPLNRIEVMRGPSTHCARLREIERGAERARLNSRPRQVLKIVPPRNFYSCTLHHGRREDFGQSQGQGFYTRGRNPSRSQALYCSLKTGSANKKTARLDRKDRHRRAVAAKGEPGSAFGDRNQAARFPRSFVGVGVCHFRRVAVLHSRWCAGRHRPIYLRRTRPAHCGHRSIRRRH